jgi:hypothetical protein
MDVENDEVDGLERFEGIDGEFFYLFRLHVIFQFLIIHLLILIQALLLYICPYIFR